MEDRYKAILQRDPLLATFSEDARAAFIMAVRVKAFEPNVVIFSDGDIAQAYYGILSGEVSINKITYDGRQSVLARLTSPGWFGELSFLDHGPRVQNAHTVGHTVLAVVPKADMLRLMDTYLDIYKALVTQTTYLMRLLYAGIDDLLLMSPERRLAKKFIDGLSVERGELVSGGTIKASQQELALFVGISRQSVNRILRIWEDKGFIKRGYGVITIVREAAFRRMIE